MGQPSHMIETRVIPFLWDARATPPDPNALIEYGIEYQPGYVVFHFPTGFRTATRGPDEVFWICELMAVDGFELRATVPRDAHSCSLVFQRVTSV